jgi:hypothetical protein
VDSAAIYEALRDTAERFGWVGAWADEKLEEAAQAIADDPQNA